MDGSSFFAGYHSLFILQPWKGLLRYNCCLLSVSATTLISSLQCENSPNRRLIGGKGGRQRVRKDGDEVEPDLRCNAVFSQEV